MMGGLANGRALRLCAWAIFAAVTAANAWLVWGLAAEADGADRRSAWASPRQ